MAIVTEGGLATLMNAYLNPPRDANADAIDEDRMEIARIIANLALQGSPPLWKPFFRRRFVIWNVTNMKSRISSPAVSVLVRGNDFGALPFSHAARHLHTCTHTTFPTDSLLPAILESSWVSVLVEWSQQRRNVALEGEAVRALANLDGAAVRLKLEELTDKRARGVCACADVYEPGQGRE